MDSLKQGEHHLPQELIPGWGCQLGPLADNHREEGPHAAVADLWPGVCAESLQAWHGA